MFGVFFCFVDFFVVFFDIYVGLDCIVFSVFDNWILLFDNGGKFLVEYCEFGKSLFDVLKFVVVCVNVVEDGVGVISVVCLELGSWG